MLRTFSVLPVPSDLKGGSVYVFINVRWQLEIKPSTCISYILLPDLLNKFISALTTSDWSPCKKTIPGVSMDDPFFPAVTRLTWPGLEWMTCQAGKKKPWGKREKLEPPKSHGGLDGLQMIFFLLKKNRWFFLVQILVFRVLYLVLFHGFESYIFILGDTGFLCTIRRNLWCIC